MASPPIATGPCCQLSPSLSSEEQQSLTTSEGSHITAVDYSGVVAQDNLDDSPVDNDGDDAELKDRTAIPPETPLHVQAQTIQTRAKLLVNNISMATSFIRQAADAGDEICFNYWNKQLHKLRLDQSRPEWVRTPILEPETVAMLKQMYVNAQSAITRAGYRNEEPFASQLVKAHHALEQGEEFAFRRVIADIMFDAEGRDFQAGKLLHASWWTSRK